LDGPHVEPKAAHGATLMAEIILHINDQNRRPLGRKDPLESIGSAAACSDISKVLQLTKLRPLHAEFFN
jgi:hypothetical protein